MNQFLLQQEKLIVILVVFQEFVVGKRKRAKVLVGNILMSNRIALLDLDTFEVKYFDGD